MLDQCSTRHLTDFISSIKTDHHMESHCAEKMIEFYSDKNVSGTNHVLEPRPKTACLSEVSIMFYSKSLQRFNRQ